ncbi:MAG: tetratricopeptide repeat protein [bacterium]|nr:tetratricopeptide repeat protein [bacterium]
MAKVIRLSDDYSSRLGLKKVRRRKKPDLEDHGQLNMFTSEDSKIIHFKAPSSLFDIALNHDEDGKDEAAEEYYLKAIDKGELKDDAYCNLGILRTKQGRLPESVDLFSKALQVNSRHLESHFNLGNVYSDMGNNKLAKFHYETALIIDPNFADCFYNLALLFIEEKSYDEAIRSLLKYQQLLGYPEESVQSLINDLKTLM